MSFYAPDTDAFPALTLAKRVLTEGGAMGAVLNAADEVAVAEFLKRKIGFTEICEVVSRTLDKLSYMKNRSSLDGLLEADREARRVAHAIIQGEES